MEPIIDLPRSDRQRNRGHTFDSDLTRLFVNQRGETREETAFLFGLNPRKLTLFLTSDPTADTENVRRVAEGCGLAIETLIRKVVPSVDPFDPIYPASRHWMRSVLLGKPSAPAGVDVRLYLYQSDEPAYRALNRDQVDRLVYYLLCLGLVGIDDQGSAFVIDRWPRHVMEKQVMCRLVIENAAVEYNFHPERRPREELGVLGGMQKRIPDLMALVNEEAVDAASPAESAQMLREFYAAEPLLHLEKAGDDGRLRELLSLTMQGGERVEHELLELYLVRAEQRRRAPDLQPLFDNARRMLRDHAEFIRLGQEAATVEQLVACNERHVESVMSRFDECESLRLKVLQCQKPKSSAVTATQAWEATPQLPR